MTENTGLIYKATCLINNKSYIGKTEISLQKRKNSHYIEAKNKRYNSIFYKAIRKYGKENFTWEVLGTYEILFLSIMETMKIITHHTHISEGGYNMTWGGDGIQKGYKHTEEQNKMKSDRVLGDKNPFYGKHHTEETKRKHSLDILGKHHTEESIRKIKENHVGMLGKHHTDETKEKIRVKKSGVHLTDEHKKKISISGRKYSEEIMNEAIRLRKTGISWIKLSKLMNINDSTIRYWCKISKK